MTQRLMSQVHIGRHHERASLAPKGAVRVRGVWRLA
jgi:hypothetical protein